MKRFFSKNRAILTLAAILISIGVVISGTIFLYRILKQEDTTPLQAIPSSATMILKTNATPTTWKELVSKTDMWLDLGQFEDFGKLNPAIHWIDSLTHSDALIAKTIQEWPLYISMHPNAKNSFSLLFAMEIPNDFKKGITKFLEQAAKNHQLTKSESEGISIFKGPSDRFSFYIAEGLFVGSYDALLLSESAAQINLKKGVITDTQFQQISVSEGKKTPISLYINHNNSYKSLAPLFNPKAKSFIESLSMMGGWSNTDVIFRKDLLLMSGYLATNKQNYLSCFKDASLQKTAFAKELDENTFFFYAMSIYDLAQYKKAYAQLNTNNKTSIKETEYYSGDLNSVAKLWLQLDPNQMVVSATTFENETHWILTLKPNDIGVAENILASEVAHRASITAKADTTSYEGYKIGKLSLQHSARIFGDRLFSMFPVEYYAIGKEHILFAATESVLKNNIKQTKAGMTLENSYLFKSYSHDLNTESLLLVYLSPIQALNFLEQYTDLTKQSNRAITYLAKKTPYIGAKIGGQNQGLNSVSFCWKYLLTSTEKLPEIASLAEAEKPVVEPTKEVKKEGKKSKKKSSKKSTKKSSKKASKSKAKKTDKKSKSKK